jgi:hypothetical protein
MHAYIGRRDASTTPGEEHDGSNPNVVLIDGGQERSLEEATEPADYPITVTGGFEWGYGGSGPLNLAAAILNDALGFLPAASVVFDFCDSVIAELPRLEFELTPDVLQTWLDARLASGAEAAREATGSEHF